MSFLLFALAASLFGIVGGLWLLSSGLSSPKSVLRTAPYGVVENGPFLITCGAKIRVAGGTEGRIFRYFYLRRRPLRALKTNVERFRSSRVVRCCHWSEVAQELQI